MQSQDLEKIIDAAFEDRAKIDQRRRQAKCARRSKRRSTLLDSGKLRIAEKIAGESGPGALARQSMAEEGHSPFLPTATRRR